MTCARCGGDDHTVSKCQWPTDTDDEPVTVPYVPPVLDDDDCGDEWM